jgi:hypothetical protein
MEQSRAQGSKIGDLSNLHAWINGMPPYVASINATGMIMAPNPCCDCAGRIRHHALAGSNATHAPTWRLSICNCLSFRDTGYQDSRIRLSSAGDPLAYPVNHGSLAGGGFVGAKRQFNQLVSSALRPTGWAPKPRAASAKYLIRDKPPNERRGLCLCASAR